MARIWLLVGCKACHSVKPTRRNLPSDSLSFSTYLFFINTKTRQPVGFQSTDIVD